MLDSAVCPACRGRLENALSATFMRVSRVAASPWTGPGDRGQSSIARRGSLSAQGEAGQLQQRLDQRDRDVAILEADIVQALRDVRDACRGESEALQAAETEREVIVIERSNSERM